MNSHPPAPSLALSLALLLASTIACGEEENEMNGEDLPETSIIECGPHANEEPPQGGALEATALIDLGADCLVPTHIESRDGRAYVTCSGTWGEDEGRLIVLDLADLSIRASTHLGGMAGPIAVSEDHVIIADGSDGVLFMTDLEGQVIHDQSDPIVLCPSDPEAGVFQFIMGLMRTAGGELLASCFATSEVVRFFYSREAEHDGTHHAVVTGRAVAGDGPGALARLRDTDAVVIDSLAGTATLVHLNEEVETSVGRWMLGEAPNDIEIEDGIAIVTNSTSQTLQVLDLEGEPESATVEEVFIGDGTNPMNVALLPDGSALVSLLLSDQLATVNLSEGKVTSCIDLPAGEDLLPLDGMSPFARPSDLTITEDGLVLVALNNLDADWSPAGHGLVAVFEIGEEHR